MTSRPHVLMTADAVGGVWAYAVDLGRGLVEAGVRVTLAVPGPTPDIAQSDQAEAAGMELDLLGGPLDWTAADASGVAVAAERLSRLCARLRPDLLHLNSPALAAFGPFAAPVIAACHSCVKTWWRAVEGQTRLPDDLAWRARLVALGYQNAAALVAPSRAFSEATQAAYGLTRAPDVVWNGRAASLDGAAPSWADGDAAEGGPQRERPGPMLPPVETEADVLTAGRLWDAGKDVATLDRAVARAGVGGAAAGSLIGPDGQGVAFRSLRALGRLTEPDLRARLARRPVFVSPSLYEPFGLAVLEAAQAGCALVLCDIPSFRELWDGAAVFFPPGDDAVLADVLQTLVADLPLRARLGHAARLRAASYTVQAMTHATLRLYARVSDAFAARQAA